MIYHQLFAQIDRTVRVGVIGTGQYATALVTQSRVVDQLDVPVVCDTNPDAAQNAYHHAGLDSDKTIIADTGKQATEAIERGKHVILTDAMQMMDLPSTSSWNPQGSQARARNTALKPSDTANTSPWSPKKPTSP